LQKELWIFLTVTFTPQILQLYAQCPLKLAKVKQIDLCDFSCAILIHDVLSFKHVYLF